MSSQRDLENHNQVNILQWNTQGIRNKKDEILEIIENKNPAIIALQETKLSSDNFRIPNYNSIGKIGHINRTPHGGVMIMVHDSIPYQEITLNTAIQAIAIKAYIGRLITFCCIYISRAHEMNERILNELINQLPKPFILMGDFNSYNPLWGSRTRDCRGRIVEEVINRNRLNILNDGQPTRITHNAETAIDLSICSPILTPLLNWEVSSSPGDSDHCPIMISIINNTNQTEYEEDRYNTKKTIWKLYTECNEWNTLQENLEGMTNEEIIEKLYKVIEIALKNSSPTYKVTKFYPKPWWNNNVKTSKNKREKLYQKYRRTKSIENLLAWKKREQNIKD
jgi:exonuclease III